jgi:D-psicose/D-tagatose/L-ribulose 3-epimerase
VNPIGVNAWVWVSPLTDERLAVLAPRVRDWGFDVLELPIEQPGDWEPARAAEVLASCGLGASVALVMAPGRELAGADRAVIAATQEYLRGCIDAAAAIGARAVCGPAYSSTGRTWLLAPDERRALYAELTESLRPVVEHGAERGVRLGIEPLVRYETSVINTVEQALDAFAELPAEWCGILFDTYHANVEERGLAAALRLAGDRLVHVHACGNDRGAPGADDNIDWPGVRDALREIGYDGGLVIESFTGENDAIARAASVWRPLAASQDAIATDGLAFLRELLGTPVAR